MPKPFKTFDEQMDILSQEGLTINGEQSKERLRNNLKKFNMQELIDGYNDPFFVGYNRQNSYRSSVNSDMIIDFFEFEKEIANLLIKTILKIETQLNTSICYEILLKMSPYNVQSIYKLEYSNMAKIFNPNENFLLNVNLKQLFKKGSYKNSKGELIKRLSGDTNVPIYIKKINNNNYEIVEKQSSAQYSVINTFDSLNFRELLVLDKLKIESVLDATSHDLVIWRKENRNENIEDMALYVISLSWTFGKTNYFFKYLNVFIKRKIIDDYFTQFSSLKTKSFVFILEILRLLRNKISHNNVIYNTDYFKLIEKIYPGSKNTILSINSDISSKLNINITNREIRLFQIVEILNTIIPEDDIYNSFQAKLDNFRSRIDSESFRYIKSKLGIS